jgi:hypothetical protein
MDAGNIFNLVKVGAANMETEKLKKEFGKYITFWGRVVDQQNIYHKIT